MAEKYEMEENSSLTFQDSPRHKKGYFISKGQLIVCLVAVICLIIIIAVLSATFSWYAAKNDNDRKSGTTSCMVF